MRQHPISSDIIKLKNELNELEKMDIKPQEAIMSAVQFSALASWVKEQGVKTIGYFSVVF